MALWVFHLNVTGEEVKVTAAAWMDKKPMLVVATSGTDEVLPISERVRSKYQQGRIVRVAYAVEERMLHGQFRNTIDIFSKLAIGPGTVANAWKSRRLLLKFSFTFLLRLKVMDISPTRHSARKIQTSLALNGRLNLQTS